MYCINFSGGDNKPHGQIERADRIDSFQVPTNRGLLIASRAGSTFPLHCEHFFEEKREVVELYHPGSRWRCTLELGRVASGFGGNRAFWLCPNCGHRSRFLYFKKLGFVCRECAKLNYLSQQRTKSSINHFRDGMRLATEKLHWAPLIDIVPMDFPYMTPDRPKGMHQTTYLRYLARYRRYQKKYQRDSLREMLAILR